MGVIQRQGIKQSIVSYIGIAIGAVSVLFIYPKVLTGEEYGFIQILMSTAKVFLPVVLMGNLYTIVRFFPDFEDSKKGHNGYLPFILFWTLLGFGLFTIGYLFYEEEIFSLFKEVEKDFVAKHGIYLLPILLFLATGTVLTKYISNFYRIVVPAIFNELFLKIGVPALCGLYYFDFIKYENILQGIGILFFVVTVCLLIYTQSLGQLFLKPRFEKFTKEKIKSMLSYAGYGFLGSLGSAIIPFIDTLMVGVMEDLMSSAIYTIPNFMTSAIDAPRRAISNITSPLLMESWKKGDQKHIKELYQKTALNQLIVGLILFLMLWSSIDHIYALMPEGPNRETYEAGKYVVLILGISKVLDMATGVNSEIIGYSQYFKFNFYAVLLLTVFAILTNYLLIPIYGVEGAAMATFLSFGIFNFSKFIFLWWKLQLQPFSRQTVKVLALGVFAYGVVWIEPNTSWSIINIFIKSMTIGLILGGGVLYFRVSEDLSNMVEGRIKKYLN